MLDQNYEIQNKMSYSEYYNKVKTIAVENEEKSLILNEIIDGVDKIIFYKFNYIKEELSIFEKLEIRNKIIIYEDLLKETLQIINLLICN
jgi:hypothetical protein